MDYNIKFEYKGIGKQASAQRQKAIQAQKTAEKQQQSQGPNTPTNNRELINTLQKLIESNKRLETAISRGGSGGGGSAPGRNIPIPHSSGGGGGEDKHGVGGIGSVGSSIPLLGAGIAALGFLAQKINQIGNAYIDLTSKQVGTVGTGGFRSAQDIWGSADMGAGMAGYSKGTGRFERGGFANNTALQMSAIYGLSPSETLHQAGVFKRAGADYEGAAHMGAGAGIESELPIMMTGMAQILEEAIKSGLDASDMSKNMAKNLTLITNRTPGKSMEAALGMVKSFSGIQKQVGEGQIGSLEGLMTYKASENILMSKINDPAYLKKMQEQGFLGEEDVLKLSKKKTKIKSSSELREVLDPMTVQEMILSEGRTADPSKLMMDSVEQMQGVFGKGPKGMMRALNATGGMRGLSRDQFRLAYLAQKDSKNRAPAQDSFQEFSGAQTLQTNASLVFESPAGTGAGRTVERENFLLAHGSKFAEATILMEQSLRNLAENGIGIATKGMEGLGKAVNTLSGMVDSFSGSLDKLKNSFMFKSVFGN